MNKLFLKNIFKRKNTESSSIAAFDLNCSDCSDYSLLDISDDTLKLRDLLLSAVIFIFGNFTAVVFLSSYDYQLAAQYAFVQLVVTLFLLYKLKSSLSF